MRSGDSENDIQVFEAECRVFEAIKRIAEREARRYGIFSGNTEFDDLVGTVIERVWTKGVNEGAYKTGTTGLDAYATTIAQNLLKDLFKSQRNQREVVDDGTLINRSDVRAKPLDTPDAVVDALHLKNVVNEILAKAVASDENVEVFIQKYCDGDSLVVTAATLQGKVGYEVTVGSIKQRLFHTKVALGKAAHRLGYDDIMSVLDPTAV